MTEVELIQLLTKRIPRRKGELKQGIGDDCSIIRMGKKDILITVDSLVEDVHFRRSWGSFEVWGKKLAGVSLSDVAAMGGSPKFAWIHLGLPRNFKTNDSLSFYRGLLAVLKKFGTVLAGGNTSGSPKGFAAHLTVWGEVPAGKSMLRSKAKPGMRIFLSGKIRPPSLKHKPQIHLGQILRRMGCRCCIDISDGLLSDLNHVAQASRVKIVLNADCIPLEGISLKKGLAKGEQYLLACAMRKNPGMGFKEIGFVAKGSPSLLVLDKKSRPITFPQLGHDHFSSNRD